MEVQRQELEVGVAAKQGEMVNPEHRPELLAFCELASLWHLREHLSSTSAHCFSNFDMHWSHGALGNKVQILIPWVWAGV